MLEKNKDYIEMRVFSTDYAFVQNEATKICVDGYAYTTHMNIPDPGELYILISKDKFEKMQAENEELKKKLQVPDPFAEYKELLKKLYSIEDTEALEWTLNHICGGQASANGWRASSQFWNGRYKDLLKLVGFSSKKEVEDYLVNEAECDTLQEAVSKLKDQVKYTCDEWYSANSRNNSWKAAAECNSPKELIEKREALKKEIEVYSRALKEWKEITGCPSPSSAKTLIESGASWHHAYRDVKKANEKLADSIKSWRNATGYSTPEGFLAAMINNTTASLQSDLEHYRTISSSQAKYIYNWKETTGCDTPEAAKERIKALNERIDESEACYNHLLMLTGFESEGEIEDSLDKCDHSTLRKALVDYEFDYEELLKLTGYKSNQDIRVELNHGEQFVYENMRELINSLKRKAKFTESNWQEVTGFSAPEKCSSYIDRLEKKLEDIKNLTEED